MHPFRGLKPPATFEGARRDQEATGRSKSAEGMEEPATPWSPAPHAVTRRTLSGFSWMGPSGAAGTGDDVQLEDLLEEVR